MSQWVSQWGRFTLTHKKVGIDIDSSDWGIWLEKGLHRKKSYQYNKLWEEFWTNGGAKTIEDVRKFVNGLDKFW